MPVDTDARAVRRLQIWASRRGGQTLAAVGREFGVTRERVRIIVLQVKRSLSRVRDLGMFQGD
jgi:DNA-directed RNA polymerase sigma subunit (sigma70/sigma32)